MTITESPLSSRPLPYDGKRKGVVGVVMALTAISRQLDYIIWRMERSA
jgi:hypothetical protein